MRSRLQYSGVEWMKSKFVPLNGPRQLVRVISYIGESYLILNDLFYKHSSLVFHHDAYG